MNNPTTRHQLEMIFIFYYNISTLSMISHNANYSIYIKNSSFLLRFGIAYNLQIINMISHSIVEKVPKKNGKRNQIHHECNDEREKESNLLSTVYELGKKSLLKNPCWKRNLSCCAHTTTHLTAIPVDTAAAITYDFIWSSSNILSSSEIVLYWWHLRLTVMISQSHPLQPTKRFCVASGETSMEILHHLNSNRRVVATK